MIDICAKLLQVPVLLKWIVLVSNNKHTVFIADVLVRTHACVWAGLVTETLIYCNDHVEHIEIYT